MRPVVKRAKARLKSYQKRHRRAARALRESKRLIASAKRVIKRHTKKRVPLRLRAYHNAVSQLGVHGSGGNNAGLPFERYQRPNGATGPEPWCGDFMAWCYRKAGSTRVSRAWAAVRLLRGLVGVYKVKHPKRGDLVRWDWNGDGVPDHVSMFEDDNGNGTIDTLDGNVDPGDEVDRRTRSKSLVFDYLHVAG